MSQLEQDQDDTAAEVPDEMAGTKQEDSDLQDQVESEPLRVAMLIDDQALARIGSLIHHICTGLVDEAVSITLLLPEQIDPQVLPVPAKTLGYRKGLLPWQAARSMGSLADQLSQHKPQVLHSLTGSSAALCTKLAQMLELPYVVGYTGLTGYECYSRLDGNLCKGLLAGSKPVQKLLEEIYPRFSDRLILLRPGCHVPSQATQGDRQESQVKEQNSHQTLMVLAMGDMDRTGGFDLLLQAADKILQQDMDVMFFLIGEGPMENSLRRWAGRAGYNDRITFAPSLAQPADRFGLAAIFNYCDLFVMPTPIKMLVSYPYEAMAHGSAVIAARGGALDMIKDKETGLLFEPGKVDDMTDQISRALSNSNLRRQLGQAARQYIKENHSVSATVGQLISIYNRAAGLAEPDNLPQEVQVDQGSAAGDQESTG